MSHRLARWNPCFLPAGLLLLAAVAGSSGCCCPVAPGGCLPYASTAVGVACDDCGGMGCDGACGAGGGPACGMPAQAFPATCGTLAPGGCGGLSGLMLPLLSTRLACGSGCGDVYWGEWIFDPPECCDGCNDDGCWAGSAGNAPYGGYHGGCLQGILAGPVAVIRGTYLGVTGILQGTCATVQSGCGISYGHGYGHEYPMGVAEGCDCAECTGTIASPACSSCGAAGCGGACVQTASPTPAPIAAKALGTGVAGRRVARAAAYTPPATKPPHRLVAKRLRRGR
jgi:hypothetical protein